MTKLGKIAVGVVLCWFAGFAAFNYYITHYKTDTTSKTDAIIALTGGSNRIKEAVDLLNKDYSSVLFISGVEKNVSLENIMQTQKLSLKKGKKIFIGRASTNTLENAIETNEWIKKNNIRSIRLVTSNYHLPRSYTEFKFRNKDVDIIVNPVFSDKVSSEWWKNGGSFLLTASEYSKFLLVWAKCFVVKLIEG